MYKKSSTENVVPYMPPVKISNSVVEINNIDTSKDYECRVTLYDNNNFNLYTGAISFSINNDNNHFIGTMNVKTSQFGTATIRFSDDNLEGFNVVLHNTYHLYLSQT